MLITDLGNASWCWCWCCNNERLRSRDQSGRGCRIRRRWGGRNRLIREKRGNHVTKKMYLFNLPLSNCEKRTSRRLITQKWLHDNLARHQWGLEQKARAYREPIRLPARRQWRDVGKVRRWAYLNPRGKARADFQTRKLNCNFSVVRNTQRKCVSERKNPMCGSTIGEARVEAYLKDALSLYHRSYFFSFFLIFSLFSPF